MKAFIAGTITLVVCSIPFVLAFTTDNVLWVAIPLGIPILLYFIWSLGNFVVELYDVIRGH